MIVYNACVESRDILFCLLYILAAVQDLRF